MNPGLLSELLEFQRQTVIRDAAGQRLVDFDPLVACRGRLKRNTGSQTEAGGRDTGNELVQFTVRSCEIRDVRRTDHCLWEGERYRIEALTKLDRVYTGVSLSLSVSASNAANVAP